MQQPRRVEGALAVARDNERAAIVLVRDKVKGPQNIGISQSESLVRVLTWTEERAQRRLPVLGHVDAAATVEHAHLMAQHALVELSAGEPRCVVCGVPGRIVEEGRRVDEEDVDFRVFDDRAINP